MQQKLALFTILLLACPMLAADTPGITIDKAKKTVSIDAKVAPRKLAIYDQTYPIEVIACWAHPKGKKAHETVVTIDVDPSAVHKALEDIGMKPGKPVKGGEVAPTGPDVKVFIEIPSESGGPGKRLSMDKVLIDPKSKKGFPKEVRFRFTGSAMIQPDPSKPEMKYGADSSGTLIAIFPVTDETVCQSSLTMKEEKYLKLEVNTDLVPKEGTAVKLVLEAASK